MNTVCHPPDCQTTKVRKMENTRDNNSEQNNEKTTSDSSVEQLKELIDNPMQHSEAIDYKSLDGHGLRLVLLAILENNPATVSMCFSDITGLHMVSDREDAEFWCKVEDALVDMFSDKLVAASFIKGDISGAPYTKIVYGYSPQQLLGATLR